MMRPQAMMRWTTRGLPSRLARLVVQTMRWSQLICAVHTDAFLEDVSPQPSFSAQDWYNRWKGQVAYEPGSSTEVRLHPAALGIRAVSLCDLRNVFLQEPIRRQAIRPTLINHFWFAVVISSSMCSGATRLYVVSFNAAPPSGLRASLLSTSYASSESTSELLI